MAKMAVDLSKFKHVKSDNKSTTLQHEDGHEMTLQHSKLPEDFVKQMKSMKKFADGGDTTPSVQPDDKPSDSSTMDSDLKDAVSGNYGNKSNLTDPGAPKDMIDSGMDALKDFSGDQILSPTATQSAAQMGTMSSVGAPDQQGIAHDQKFELSGDKDQSASPQVKDPAPSAVPDLPAQSTQPQVPQGLDGEDILMGGFNKASAGINAEAKAKGDLGDTQAKLLTDQHVIDQKLLTDYQSHYSNLETERQAMIKDIRDGYIDPNKYWTGDANGNGGHSKISAGIGMILGGFNTTPGARNGAVDMMQYQMNQNMAAQEKNLGVKQSLLSNNLAQFGNLKEATAMTRIMQTDMLSHQIEAAAAKSQSPLAKGAAMQAVGQLQMQIAPQIRQFAMMRTMNNLLSQPNNGSPEGASPTAAIERALPAMRMVNPEMAKSYEQKIVSGIGVAGRDVTPADRDKMVAHQDVERQMNQVLSFAKDHGNSFDPRVRGEGATLMNSLQDSMRRATGAGVYKESEAHFMSSTMGDNPAKFGSSITTVPKIKELLQMKHAEYNNLLHSYALPAQGVPQQPASGGGDQQFKMVNGVKYMRGPKGEAIKVK
jgi:hypothetical protein